MIILNILVCFAIAVRLFMFKRDTAKYKIHYSLLAWGLICASGSVGIFTLFNQVNQMQIAQVIMNVIILICLLKSKGNVSQTIYTLFDTPKSNKHHKKRIN